MCDKVSRATGCILVLFSLLLILAGSFPALHQYETHVYLSRNKTDLDLQCLHHLSQDDLINIGTVEELCSLPGIGESIGALISNERDINGLFVYPEDVLSVKGIGEKKLEKLRPYLHLVTDDHESGE